MPHYVVLSPLESPIAYAFFGMDWICSLSCILVALHFYRAKKGAWWMLVAVAFALPPMEHIGFCLMHGLPPLPYGLKSTEQFPSGQIVVIKNNVHWDST